MSELICEYRDTKGLLVSEDRIVELLDAVDKTEDEVINFLGKDRIEVNGFMLSFLTTFQRQEQFYYERAIKEEE